MRRSATVQVLASKAAVAVPLVMTVAQFAKGSRLLRPYLGQTDLNEFAAQSIGTFLGNGATTHERKGNLETGFHEVSLVSLFNCRRGLFRTFPTQDFGILCCKKSGV